MNMPEHDVLSLEVKKNGKNSNFGILSTTQHVAHLLKLAHKMCKYEIDPASIVEDTEQTQLRLQMIGWTEWNQYTPLNFVGGV